jgi:hypothetical protein
MTLIEGIGAAVSALAYNMIIILFSSYILVPTIVFSVVGAAWLFGRAGERIGLLKVSRAKGSGGGEDDEHA